ncbi:MAG: transcriptional regulator NrdR [bacterium]|nr:transcriptional regulator NrdR [bacterium]
MKCPLCSAKDSRVLDSRITGDGLSIRRRRECIRCHFRFSTLEDVQLLDLMVLKRNGRREPYNREKLIRGLAKALEKRPITQEQLKTLVRTIEVDLQRKRGQEITSRDVGEMVMRRLEKFDHVAYIRFASVYRQFEDVRTFQKELARLLSTTKQSKKPKKK